MQGNIIADRVLKIDASGIRKVFDLAATLKDPINLSIGQPDFDVPLPIKQKAVDSIAEGKNKYTPTQGIASLINDVMQYERQKTGRDFEDGIITSGVSGGITLTILALINPGDEVIIFDPYFVIYKHIVNMFGGVPIYVDTYPDFDIDIDKLKAAITKKTKLIILNSPSNPTGKVISEDRLREIAKLLEGSGIYIMSDEIYDRFVYDGEFKSIASYYENVILLNGFSKSFAATGWRVGYLLGPKNILAEMKKIQQYTFVCAPTPFQNAFLGFLNEDISHIVEQYKEKRDIIYNGLKDKFEVIKPEGAFYIFVKVPYGNDMEFVERAIKNNVLIIPGSVFSQRATHFRISYAQKDEILKKGIEVLNSLI